jgi:hypothetical protein
VSAQLPFGPSCGDVWLGNSYGHSGVDSHEAWFVTNPALDGQSIVPLGCDVEQGVVGGRYWRSQCSPFPTGSFIPSHQFSVVSYPMSVIFFIGFMGADLSKMVGAPTVHKPSVFPSFC